MMDDEMPRNAKDEPRSDKPEQVEGQEQQSQAATMVRPNRQTAPGRRPLFRN